MKAARVYLIICCVLMFTQVGYAQDKIGVVDIQSIVNKSCEVNALKNEHAAQLKSLSSIVTEAQDAISKESDPQKIVMLQDKYNAEFNRKKEAIDNQYQSRLTAIENNLRNQISASAKKHNYDIIIAKSVVFYGGDDITDLVSADIK